MNTTFEKIAPYLKDPLVLIGFFFLLAFSFSRYLIKRGVIQPLPKTLGYRILRLLLLYGFILGLLLIILGFQLKRQELSNEQQTVENISRILRQALAPAYWLPAERKTEIEEQIVAGYRSGALTQKDVQQKIEEINRSVMIHNNFALVNGTVEQKSTTDKAELKPDSSQSPIKSDEGTKPTSEPATQTRYIVEPSGAIARPEERNTPAPVIPVLVPAASAATNAQCSVSINKPENNAEVSNAVLVRGAAKLPSAAHLWMFSSVKYSGNWRVGEFDKVNIDKDGTWNITISLEGEPGIFQIAAMAVTDLTNDFLKQRFSSIPMDSSSTSTDVDFNIYDMFNVTTRVGPVTPRSISTLLPATFDGCQITYIEVKKIGPPKP